jgi:hypothetical protein
MSRLPRDPEDLRAAIEAAVQERTAARHRLRDAPEDAARDGPLLTPEEFLPLWNAWKRAQRKLDALRRAAKEGRSQSSRSSPSPSNGLPGLRAPQARYGDPSVKHS